MPLLAAYSKREMNCFYGLVIWAFTLSYFVNIQETQAKWWFVSQLGSSVTTSSWVHCKNIPGLVRRQRRLCEKHPDLMLAVADGAAMAIRECQHRFQDSRWNCSIIPRDASVFGNHLLRSTREAAFVYSLNSAAVVYAVIKSCSTGQIPNCACDVTKAGVHKDKAGTFTWGGCSDNLKFGSAFARRFIDAPDKRQRDVRALSNLHNNRVGRKSIRKNTKLECKCHGVSGSCTTRTCWLTLSQFRTSSLWLKRRYEHAVPVNPKPGGDGIASRKGRRNPRKTDLVYLEKSPDYCESNLKKGLPGTGGRQCNISSLGMDGCGSLCCGRGYYSERKWITSQCGCSFRWCCEVACQTCEAEKDVYFCKSNGGT